jgi:uncharacterized protein with HEPN domain
MHTQHCKRSNGTLHHALAALEQNEQAQDAIVRTLTVIGEAAVRIQKAAPEFVAAHPELPWSPMRGIRNKVVHDYFDVAWDVVWDTVKQDLPPLLEQVKSLLNSSDSGPT